MKNLLVVNLQSFGDILLSTHIATLAHKYVPDWAVHFAFRKDLTLTTAEQDINATKDMMNIIGKQPYVKSVGLVENGLYHGPLENQPDAIIVIQGWSSELGIVRSQLKPFYDIFGIPDSIDTETKFWGGSLSWNDPTMATRIAIPGDLDFLRKWGNEEEYKKFLAYLSETKYNIKIEKFGVDTVSESYWNQLQRLHACSLVISPMGSLIHAAAGFGCDTINISSVFPSEYDSPEFYHSGYHKTIKVDTKSDLHCGSFKCVQFKPEDSQQSWGNPPTQFGFWIKDCPYTKNKKSCIYNIKADLLIEKFEEWYGYRYN